MIKFNKPTILSALLCVLMMGCAEGPEGVKYLNEWTDEDIQETSAEKTDVLVLGSNEAPNNLLTDHQADILSKSPTLTSIDLLRVTCSKHAIAKILSNKNLENVQLRLEDLDHEIIHSIAHHPKLTSLAIADTPVMPVTEEEQEDGEEVVAKKPEPKAHHHKALDFAPLAKSKTIEKVYLQTTDVTEKEIMAISKMHHLKHLLLNLDNDKLSTHVLAKILSHAKSLKSMFLVFSKIGKHTVEELKALRTTTKLEELAIVWTNETGADAGYHADIVSIIANTNLKELRLLQSHINADMATLMLRNKSLKRIVVSEEMISDEAREMLEGDTNLKLEFDDYMY